MKLLLDTCVARSARDGLVQAGHDVVWAALEPPDPGDLELLKRGHRDARVFVTLDKDFGELAVVRGIPHAGIVRLVGFRASGQAAACLSAIERYSEELLQGAIVTVEPGRVRLRPA